VDALASSLQRIRIGVADRSTQPTSACTPVVTVTDARKWKGDVLLLRTLDEGRPWSKMHILKVLPLPPKRSKVRKMNR
jgi:hypothetical protein